jgi:hypothetical protein
MPERRDLLEAGVPEPPENANKISFGECQELLRGQAVGRLGVVVDGGVEIFPVNYGLDGDGILFRTDPGTKTRGLFSGEVVFEVDRIDDETHSGWSVIVRGTAEDITRFDGPVLGGRADEPWAGPKQCLVRIRPHTVTGRLVGQSADAGQFPDESATSRSTAPLQSLTKS